MTMEKNIIRAIAELGLSLDKVLNKEYGRQIINKKKNLKYPYKEYGKYKKFAMFIQPTIYEKFNLAKDYAGILGIGESYLSHIIHGRRKPSEELLKKISDSLDLDYETLDNLLKDGDKKKYRNN